MEESILKFAEQFQFNPEIQNADKLKGDYQSFILGGMGGSHLCAGLFHIFRPGINLYIHRDYGLPAYNDDFMSKSLFIASSYSGNTEETFDFLDAAYVKGYDVAVITSGGKLLQFAIENEIPYVLIPDTGIQPRSALGFSALSMAAFVEPGLIPELQNLTENLDSESLRDQGQEIAQILKDKIPVIYTSNQNRALGYLWKITINETGKTPSFYNVFPELNHNEMQSFDFVEKSKELAEKFAFILIHDSEDHPKIELRMRTTEDLYQEKGFEVVSLFLEGETIPEKVFKSFLLVNLIALETALIDEAEPEQVPLIEEFKRRMIK
jgi:glucose/mannose-6-phosphate isomerase